ncbi:hypothetical protein [Chitiniphilus shinanonensis]|uniref:hypothetical protein n=1 Tax=Chitiniphilus shinanonensis TaxID=553088 RepID=UPI0030299212
MRSKAHKPQPHQQLRVSRKARPTSSREAADAIATKITEGERLRHAARRGIQDRRERMVSDDPLFDHHAREACQ